MTGRLLDTNDFVQGREIPVVAATVSLLGTSSSTTSDATGRFTLSGIPGGSQILDINTTTARPAPDGSPYSGFREKIELIERVTNVVDRPFFLPRIAMESLTRVDPNTTTVVTNPTLNTTMRVPPNTAKNPDGTNFMGQLSISPVPQGLAPAALPEELKPGMLITIQPVGVTFATPVPITFPNIANLPPGSETDLWSLDPRTGIFVVVGTGRVSTDRSRIETIRGGIRAADWHATMPPGPGGNDDDGDGCCEGQCCETASTGSETAVAAGNLEVSHDLVGYSSLGQSRALRFVYNSVRAEPRPIIILNATIFQRAAVPTTVSTSLSVAGINLGAEIFTNSIGLNENIDETIRQIVQFDASAFETGVYPYRLKLTSNYPLLLPGGQSSLTVSAFQDGNVVVNNQRNSPFGAGWGLAGLERLHEIADGSVLVNDGNGRVRFFRPGIVAVNFKDFADLSSLVLNGVTATINSRPVVFNGRTVLRLTNNLGQRGGAFLNKSIPLLDGSTGLSFSTAFQFQMTNPQGTSDDDGQGADGLAFVIATSPASLGGFGIGIGYSGINPSVVVEFDTYNNGSIDGNSGNHVGINLNGNLASVVLQPVIERMNNGAIWYAWIDYDGTTKQLAVRLSRTAVRPATPLVSRTVDIAAILRQSTAFLGFTSGTGNASNDHDIRAWEFKTFDPRGSASGFISPAGDFSTLIKNSDGSYTRRMKDGTRINFNTNGMQTSVVDSNSNTTMYSYDAQGNLTAITDPVGLVTRLSYTDDGLLANITNPGGRTTTFDHDAAGNLVRITDPDGRSRQFAYDVRYRLISEISKRGFTTRYEYNFAGRHVKSALPDASTRLVTPSGTVGLVDPSSGSGTQSNPAPVVRPEAVVATFTDGNGNVLKYSTDRFGTSSVITDALGGVRRALRDRSGNVLREIFQNSDCVEASYDDAGNAVAEARMGTAQCVLPPGSRDPAQVKNSVFTYDPSFHQVTSITGPTGSTTRFEYDEKGNLTKIIDALGNSTQMTYDGRGQLLTRTDASGNTTRFVYDTKGNLIQTIDPLGNTRSSTFDAAGNLILATDAEGRTYRFEYDLMGRPIRVIDAAGGVTAITYDSNGNTSTVIDPNGNTTAFEYDVLNRVTRVTNALGHSRFYRYDANGNFVEMTDPNGQTIRYTYDALQRVVRKELPENTVSYSYDSEGNLLSVADNDSSVSFVYDEFSRLVETRTAAITGFPATTIKYTYDENDNKLTMIDPQNGVTSYAYDHLDRLTELRNPSGKIVQFSFDGLSHRTQVTLPNGTHTEFSYDAAGQLSKLIHRKGTTAIFGFDFTLNRIGDRVAITDNAGMHNFAYDVLNRLVRATHSSGSAESFSYDRVGNRVSSHLSQSYVYGAANRLLEDDSFLYRYDRNGNLLEKTSKATQLATRYIYDAENQRIRVDLPDGGFATYRYDGLGRRIERNVNGIITRYLYDEADILLELKETNTILARYTHGPEIDDPLVVEKANESFFYHTDALGSVAGLTDATGNVIRTFSYDSFGRLVGESGALQQLYTYTGREFDQESGHYYYRARYYDPIVGRFLSEDPLHQNPRISGRQGAPGNLYLYTHNNPINYTDPTGLYTVGASCNEAPFFKPAIDRAARDALQKINSGNCIKSNSLQQELKDVFKDLTIECDSSTDDCGYARLYQPFGNSISVGAKSATGSCPGGLSATILHEAVHRTQWFDDEKQAEGCDISCYNTPSPTGGKGKGACAKDCK
ncbi:hypothetical protein HY230_12400 [Candidatus Acetothermia bacterium]|nr:hypothetical protein [Candidatus Acetothermia bacterium]